MLNICVLMGRLVADPDLRQTPNGISVVGFRLAVERSYSKERERQADFIDIVAWRNTAEFVSKYFRKGGMIIVEGSIQTRGYEDKNGNKRTAFEVLADKVSFGESKKRQDEPPHDVLDDDDAPPFGGKMDCAIEPDADATLDSNDLPF